MTIRPLRNLGLRGLPKGPKLKVCIVSLIGAARNGGIGTASDAMARHIASDGHEVTLLYTLVEAGKPVNVNLSDRPCDGLATWEQWTADYSADGVQLEMLHHMGGHAAWLEKSWLVKEFISGRGFDVVYFDEWYGLGYYSLLAKKSGILPFASQLHVVFTHASKQWVCMTNDEYLRQVSDVVVLGMERRCVEMADVVIGPSQYLLEEYKNYGWNLPTHSFFHPLPLLKESIQPQVDRVPINELVFFGRLEVRKGIWLFCNTLDKLGDRLSGVTVTLMGPPTDSFGSSSVVELLSRSATWGFRVNLYTHFNSRQAQAYLAAGNRLAVMPSLDDNSPCVVYECMQAKIPFLTTSCGGAKELIGKEFWPESVFEPTVSALAERIDRVLKNGAVVAAPSFDPKAVLEEWTGWLRRVGREPEAFRWTPEDKVFEGPSSAPLLVAIDRPCTPISAMVQNLSKISQRFGKRLRLLVISSRSGKTWDAVQELLAGFLGGDLEVYPVSGLGSVINKITAAEVVFFADSDVDITTSFLLLASAAIGQHPNALVSCIGASRLDNITDAKIEILPAGDIPGLSALGLTVSGPVWAIAPGRHGSRCSVDLLYDALHGELMNAWTAGELMARRMDGSQILVVPVVGAVLPSADHVKPLQTVQALRSGAQQLGLGNSLHQGGDPWFAIATYGARSAHPAGQLSLRHDGVPKGSPLAKKLEEAEQSNDLAEMAALCGRTDFALQIEASRLTSGDRVRHLLGVAIEAERKRPKLSLIETLLNATSAVHGGQMQDAQTTMSTHAFRDSRLLFEDGHLRSVGSTRTGGPAKLSIVDVPLAGHRELAVHLRLQSSQPLYVRVGIIDQDCGEPICESVTRLTLKDGYLARLPLPSIFGRAIVMLELSGADRIDILVDTLEIQ